MRGGAESGLDRMATGGSRWRACQGRRHQRGYARLRRAMAPPPSAVFDPWQALQREQNAVHAIKAAIPTGRN